MRADLKRERQIERGEAAVRALARYGNAERAARHLKPPVHPDTLRKRVMLYCALTGHDSAVQAAYWLGLRENPSAFRTEAA